MTASRPLGEHAVHTFCIFIFFIFSALFLLLFCSGDEMRRLQYYTVFVFRAWGWRSVGVVCPVTTPSLEGNLICCSDIAEDFLKISFLKFAEVDSNRTNSKKKN